MLTSGKWRVTPKRQEDKQKNEKKKVGGGRRMSLIPGFDVYFLHRLLEGSKENKIFQRREIIKMLSWDYCNALPLSPANLNPRGLRKW